MDLALSTPQIENISAQQTWPLRQQVMWPHKPLAYVQLPDDEDGLHFGLFVDSQLIVVISLFVHGNTAQFRKFATLTTLQGKGYGSLLLQHLIADCRCRGVKSLWCHARTSALAFYQKFGLEAVGNTFEKDGIEYIKMQVEIEAQ
ncbi:GNAT family N-acetyltransferase [Flectobacillus major]|uniref:GNAT family N-acetyltransferase n=1 Tax=Flectobacillus major TaxID=103 RepID=UPI0003F78A17|nr:GNAT family N-acetyltransferase [Flectobacillus major]